MWGFRIQRCSLQILIQLRYVLMKMAVVALVLPLVEHTTIKWVQPKPSKITHPFSPFLFFSFFVPILSLLHFYLYIITLQFSVSKRENSTCTHSFPTHSTIVLFSNRLFFPIFLCLHSSLSFLLLSFNLSFTNSFPTLLFLPFYFHPFLYFFTPFSRLIFIFSFPLFFSCSLFILLPRICFSLGCHDQRRHCARYERTM